MLAQLALILNRSWFQIFLWLFLFYFFLWLLNLFLLNFFRLGFSLLLFLPSLLHLLNNLNRFFLTLCFYTISPISVELPIFSVKIPSSIRISGFCKPSRLLNSALLFYFMLKHCIHWHILYIWII